MRFDAAFIEGTTQWAQESTQRLAQRQAVWKENCRKSAMYAAAHPTKPVTLVATQVRSKNTPLDQRPPIPMYHSARDRLEVG